ncbi:hypothetical protein GMOD_00010075 [Pyrenophora seminiperda CCB06]|uniref:Uncharacterized protein n=1 Tax=Pyrenophora seminiperda CCB06 TaxID=1302712 RepID=A0A3M7M1Z7_9PLEO|nr:hypothetical protein GMOD_00010075 [Pyrenophora seminiperda CCB06]
MRRLPNVCIEAARYSRYLALAARRWLVQQARELPSVRFDSHPHPNHPYHAAITRHHPPSQISLVL